MSFDIPNIHIDEDSLEAQAIERVMNSEKLDAAGAVLSILRSANNKETPAMRMIGLFSSDEDSAIIDEVMGVVAESREAQTTRKIGL